MDSTSAGLDFAAIGHQDSWENIESFINCIRSQEQVKLPLQKIKEIFSFIPPRDLFRVKVRSQTGSEINGVYIETFIDPGKLGESYTRTNIGKVKNAMSFANKMGAGIATLGGFTSIVLEGNLDGFEGKMTKFTTGNTLTAAFIVKGIEKAAKQVQVEITASNILIMGATGDIGMACVNYFKHKCGKMLLCARNHHRLEKLTNLLNAENVITEYSVDVNDLTSKADIIICVASSSGIDLSGCKRNLLVCDAGYPKNLQSKVETNEIKLFHGGMGQVSGGFDFLPDYSGNFYQYPVSHAIHGCLLEAMVLAFEQKMENYSYGKGNITVDRIEEIYGMALKHGIDVAPFFNGKGVW